MATTLDYDTRKELDNFTLSNYFWNAAGNIKSNGKRNYSTAEGIENVLQNVDTNTTHLADLASQVGKEYPYKIADEKKKRIILANDMITYTIKNYAESKTINDGQAKKEIYLLGAEGKRITSQEKEYILEHFHPLLFFDAFNTATYAYTEAIAKNSTLDNLEKGKNLLNKVKRYVHEQLQEGTMTERKYHQLQEGLKLANKAISQREEEIYHLPKSSHNIR